MAFLRRREEGGPRAGGDDPRELVRRSQEGDGAAREELIRAYRPFVMRVAADACGRYVGPDEDEASVALLAFDEAIRVYRDDRGGSFLRFAETVIKRRLVDHFRRQGGRREVPLSELEVEDEEGNSALPVAAAAAVAAYQEEQEIRERREEIRRYQEALSRFGITFAELAAVAPKHRDAREAAQRVARAVAANQAWAAHLMEHGALPLRELERWAGLGVSRKTVERNRKYIVAVTVLLLGEYEHLRAYVAGD